NTGYSKRVDFIESPLVEFGCRSRSDARGFARRQGLANAILYHRFARPQASRLQTYLCYCTKCAAFLLREDSVETESAKAPKGHSGGCGRGRSLKLQYDRDSPRYTQRSANH